MNIDLSLVQLLYAHRTLGATYAFLGVSQLGEWYVLLGLSVVCALAFALREKFVYAQGILLSTVTSTVAAFVLKTFIQRPRPDGHLWAYLESGSSFPSAHATLSVAFFGYVAWLLWRHPTSLPRRAAAALLVLLVLAIGFSRVYLGVHYPSDVIGGWVVGSLCLSLAVWATKRLESR